MELTQIKYFTTLARELHFGRAAKKLFITQPPLSQSIKRLEEELGVKLFERNSRKVELTSAGKVFYEESLVILKKSEQAKEKMNLLASGTRGVLVIGFSEPAINTFLPEAVALFKKEYPEIKLSLKEIETSAQIEAVKNGLIDIAFSRPCGHDLVSLETELIFREEYQLALPAFHKLGKLKEISLKKLNGENLILFPRHIQPRLYDILMEHFRKHGFLPSNIQEAIEKHTTAALVEAGLGVAFLPETSKNRFSGNIIFKNVSEKLPAIDIFAVRSGEYSPAAENFLNVVRKINHSE
jgi:DNA-binding transcriptional LysR family regulator